MNETQSLLEIKTHPGNILTSRHWASRWETVFLPIGLPLLGALTLGPLLAYMLVSQAWLPAVALVCVIPAVILLNRYPFSAVIIWLALIPILPYGRVQPQIYWVLHRALIPMALIITILLLIVKVRNRSVRLGLPELVTLVYIGLVLFSILTTYRSPLTIIYMFFDRAVVGLTAYWLIRLAGLNGRELKRLVPFMFILCWAECVIGLLAWFAPQTLPEIWIFPQQGSRTTGTLGNPAAYSSTLMFLMLFLLHYAVHQKNRFIYGLTLVTFGLGLACIFFSFSRGSWLAATLTVVALLWLYPKPTATLLALALPFMLVLSVTVLSGEVAYAYKRMNTEDTLDSRRVLAHAGEQMFLAKPLFGWGYYSYDLHDWKFMEPVDGAAPTKWDIKQGTSHNTYITILAEIGVIGFFFLFLPVLYWLYFSVKAWPRLPTTGYWSRKLLVIMWLVIGYQIIVSQFMDMRFFIFPLTVQWIVLGFIANLVQTQLKPVGVNSSQPLTRSASI
ncbi:MAG: hypothetical protein DPW09_16540 [Anaerolineae bacterium]|nr:hypothetical protein [Anaerolineae bacterium]